MSSAEVVVLLHFAFIVFVAAGGLLALRWPRIAWVHLPAVAWGAWVQFADWMCPLTYLEDALRGDMLQTGGFVARYLMPVVYPDLAQAGILTPTMRIVIGCAAIGINVVIYGSVLRRWRKRRLELHDHPNQDPRPDDASPAAENHLQDVASYGER